MITRLLLIFTFIFAASGCNAETKESITSKSINSTSPPNVEIEVAINSFSEAVAKKNVTSFLNVADSKGVYLVRKFTSGNLGGRGPELSQLTNPATINEKLQFPVKNQTPYNLRIQFQELPIKSFAALTRQLLSAEVETLNFDRWEPFLKKSLSGTPEATQRAPIVLLSANSKFVVYAEAQIIDDILVGGFAVFEMRGSEMKLVALIELL